LGLGSGSGSGLGLDLGLGFGLGLGLTQGLGFGLGLGRAHCHAVGEVLRLDSESVDEAVARFVLQHSLRRDALVLIVQLLGKLDHVHDRGTDALGDPGVPGEGEGEGEGEG
jgi:hypothetical protein